MLKNYIITSFRTIARNKTYFILSTLGLSLGISCLITIYVITDFQTSYDQHQENYSEIHRVIGKYQFGDESGQTPTVPHPLGNALQSEVSGIAAISNTYMLSEQINIEQQNGVTKKIKQEKIGFAYSPLFDILSFTWVAGQPDFSNPHVAVLARSTAEKFFGNQATPADFIGRTIVLANKHQLTIAGVYEDLPENTDFPFEMITHYEMQEGVNPYFQNGKAWQSLNGGTQCLLKLEKGSNAKNVEKSINLAYEKENQIEGYELKLQPMAGIHTEPVGNYNGVVFEPKYQVTAYALAVLLAIIGSINFVNLTTARAVKRAREVGIRKVMGSRRLDLIVQFLMETFLIVAISLGLGFVFASQILILFNSMLESALQLNNIPYPQWIIFSLVVLTFTTFISGIYPALSISSFSPLSALKIKVSNIDKTSKIPLRKILVATQFTFTIFLLVGVIVIFSQLNYMRTYDMGFNTERIITLRWPNPDADNQIIIQSKIEALPAVINTSLQLGSPMARTNNTDKYFNPEVGPEEAFSVNIKTIDENYLELYGLTLLSGRNIRENDPADNVIITELALRKFNLGTPSEALGKELKSTFGSRDKIVGVVKDFNANSLKSELVPVMLYNNPQKYFELAVQLKNSKNAIAETMKDIEGIWNTMYPNLMIEYSFLDESIANRYKFEEVIGKSISFQVLMALIISVLGLYGLTDYMANSKRKEIGIRKVVGAEIHQILTLFAKEVVWLLGVSFLLSASASYYLMNLWLNGFEYHIEIGWGIMLGALLVTALTVILTMGFRSLSAARVNPVEVLKDE